MKPSNFCTRNISLFSKPETKSVDTLLFLEPVNHMTVKKTAGFCHHVTLSLQKRKFQHKKILSSSHWEKNLALNRCKGFKGMLF